MSAVLPTPAAFGSYPAQDVTWLLKDVSATAEVLPVEQRERMVQREGAHYSETLPVEYQPTPAYEALYEELLDAQAEEVATLVAALADLLVERHPGELALASLARAGTPVGVLLRRALKARHGRDVPHYAVSIIRDRGLDPVALRYLLAHHPPGALRFVDGWTGKGVIQRELTAALRAPGVPAGIDDELAVLADPAWSTTLHATREDVLIPSACLNATVSGLVSRTVLNEQLIGPGDFHGARFYGEWAAQDRSNQFVDRIEAAGRSVDEGRVAALVAASHGAAPPDWRGMAVTERLRERFGLKSVNLVKPGVGETTRVLLRRVPWQVLVRPGAELPHVRRLCEERGVPLVDEPDMPYACFGLIAPLSGQEAVQ